MNTYHENDPYGQSKKVIFRFYNYFYLFYLDLNWLQRFKYYSNKEGYSYPQSVCLQQLFPQLI